MRQALLRGAVAVLLAVGAVGAANAAVLFVVGGSGFTLGRDAVVGQTFNPTPQGGSFNDTRGKIGATLAIDSTASIRVTFLGKDALRINRLLSIDGFGIDIDNTVAGGTGKVFGPAGPGDLPVTFAFSGPNSFTSPSARIFFALIDPQTVLVTFDDGGNGNDLDFDDWVGTIRVVPVPATLPLLTTAVAGLMIVGRRRRRQASDA